MTRAGDAGPGGGDGQCMSTPPLSCHPLDVWWVRTCSSNCDCIVKPAEHCCSGHTKRGGASAGACPPGSSGRAPLMPAAQGAAAQGESSTKAAQQQAEAEQQGPKTKGQRNGRQGREHSNTSTQTNKRRTRAGHNKRHDSSKSHTNAQKKADSKKQGRDRGWQAGSTTTRAP